MSIAEKRFNKEIINNYMREYAKTNDPKYLKEALKLKRLMNER